MKSVIIIAIAFVFLVIPQVYAQTQGISITAVAEEGSNIILVTGHTVSGYTDVTFTVTSPSGNNVVDLSQVSPDENGDFATIFEIKPIWIEDGFYSIAAKQGSSSLYTITVLVEVIDGKASKTNVTESNLETGIFMPIPSTARDAGLEIYAEAKRGSTTIEITGLTDRVSQDITLTITAPNGNVVSIESFSPMLDGEFTSVITTGGPLWKQDGFYTVTARQFDDPNYTASIQIDIRDGVVAANYEIPLDEIEKITNEEGYVSTEREWITSGPFQIDRSEYLLGEKIFVRVGGLSSEEKGQIAFLRPLNDTHHSVYLTISFDGSERNGFNQYFQPQLSKNNGFCTVDAFVGEWRVVFRGTEYADLTFKITEDILPGDESSYEKNVCVIEEQSNDVGYSNPMDKFVRGTNVEPEPKGLGIASFVDKSKDPQSYIDRYNSEPAYKKWFNENYPQYASIEQAVGLELTQKIPDWVKNIFGWYAADQVSEDELLNAIKYLINEKILLVD